MYVIWSTPDVDVAMTLTVARRARPRLPRGRRDMWAEMAVYNTPADRLDLEAILNRYPDDDTEEIRSIISAQASRRRQ